MPLNIFSKISIPGSSLVVQWLRIYLPGDIGSIPGLGRFHMLQGNEAHVPQKETLPQWEACVLLLECSTCLQQLEKKKPSSSNKDPTQSINKKVLKVPFLKNCQSGHLKGHYIYVYTHTHIHTHTYVYFNPSLIPTVKHPGILVEYTQLLTIRVSLDWSHSQ